MIARMARGRRRRSSRGACGRRRLAAATSSSPASPPSSANTVVAYRSDVAQFVDWAGRGASSRRRDVDRLVLRRYVASLTTRRLAKRTVARKVAALRRYFGWARTPAWSRRRSDPRCRCAARAGEGRLPRGARRTSELATPCSTMPARHDRRRSATSTTSRSGGAGATTPCSRCSTAAGCASASCAAPTSTPSISPARRSRVWGKGAKQRRVPLSEPAVDALRAWLAMRRDVVDAGRRLGAVRQRARQAAHPTRRAADHRSPGGAPDAPARPAPLVRHAPARRRRRPARRAGAARPRRRRHHAALHPRQQGAAAAGVRGRRTPEPDARRRRATTAWRPAMSALLSRPRPAAGERATRRRSTRRSSTRSVPRPCAQCAGNRGLEYATTAGSRRSPPSRPAPSASAAWWPARATSSSTSPTATAPRTAGSPRRRWRSAATVRRRAGGRHHHDAASTSGCASGRPTSTRRRCSVGCATGRGSCRSTARRGGGRRRRRVLRRVPSG